MMEEEIVADVVEDVIESNDTISYLETICQKQQEQIEQLTAANEKLETLQLIESEQINGLQLVCNYQFATLGFLVFVSVVVFCWKVFYGWFFKPV